MKAVKGYDGKWYVESKNTIINGNYLFDFYAGRDFIIQECVDQSDEISKYNPTSINTIRLSVYRSVKDNKCHVTNAIMRIGGKGSYVDNAHAGGVFVGINSDGRLCDYVCDQYGNKNTVFNETDFSKEHIIPHYEEIKQFACEISSLIPHCRLLALDIVLRKDGKPRLIEFNVAPSSYSMWLFQFTVGPAFGDYTDEIIEYCSKHLDKVKYYFNPL